MATLVCAGEEGRNPRADSQFVVFTLQPIKNMDVAMHRKVQNINNRRRMRLRGTLLWLYKLSFLP